MTSKKELPNQQINSADEGSHTSSPNNVRNIHDFSNLWRLAFDASTDMISILDVHHEVIAVNKAMAEALGCSPLKAIGQKCHHLIHNSNNPPTFCPHQALLEDGKAHHSEVYEEKLNIWMRINAIPLYDTEENLVGSIHIARDITAQKQSEQAYRESEERYHHLSEATVEGVLLSEENTIIAANQVLADMLGYSIKELTGMNVLSFVASQNRKRLIQTLRSPTTGANKLECIRKDGTVFPIEARSRAITYKSAMVYQTAIRDLTEQERIEQERSAHERMRGVLEMAGAVCHEINQPLMALHGYLQLLVSNIDTSNVAIDHIYKMNSQIERIKQLTYKMMHITKYETKNYAGGHKIIDLDQASSENRIPDE